MGILGKIFGSDEVIRKGTDGIINGIDKLVFTQEERSDNFKTLLKLYEPFKIAQRLLALTFGIPYAAAWFIAFVAAFWVDINKQIDLLNGTMGTVILTIVGFYFAAGALEGVIVKYKSRSK